MASGAKKKKKKQQKKENLKRNILNGITIIIAVLLIVVITITALIFVYIKQSGGQVHYPESPLTKMVDQSYSYIEDETLDVTIQCPTIPVILNVGGTERFVSEYGCVFRYDNSLSISIYELEESAYDLLSTEYGKNLYNGDISGSATYYPEQAYQDVGYFNGFPAEYQCGRIDVTDENGIVYRSIYVLAMVLDLGYDKNIMIGISSTDDKSLYNAELLMESIAYTIVDTSITRDSLEKDSANMQTNTNVNVTFESELEEEEKKEVAKTSGFQHMDLEIPLLKSYEEGAVVVLQYTNTGADLSGVQIKDVFSNVISLVDTGSTKGLAFFGLKEAKKGNYTLRVPANVDLGTFSTRVMGFTEFTQEYGTILNSIQPVHNEEKTEVAADQNVQTETVDSPQ